MSVSHYNRSSEPATEQYALAMLWETRDVTHAPLMIFTHHALKLDADYTERRNPIGYMPGPDHLHDQMVATVELVWLVACYVLMRPALGTTFLKTDVIPVCANSGFAFVFPGIVVSQDAQLIITQIVSRTQSHVLTSSYRDRLEQAAYHNIACDDYLPTNYWFLRFWLMDTGQCFHSVSDLAVAFEFAGPEEHEFVDPRNCYNMMVWFSANARSFKTEKGIMCHTNQEVKPAVIETREGEPGPRGGKGKDLKIYGNSAVISHANEHFRQRLTHVLHSGCTIKLGFVPGIETTLEMSSVTSAPLVLLFPNQLNDKGTAAQCTVYRTPRASRATAVPMFVERKITPKMCGGGFVDDNGDVLERFQDPAKMDGRVDIACTEYGRYPRAIRSLVQIIHRVAHATANSEDQFREVAFTFYGVIVFPIDHAGVKAQFAIVLTGPPGTGKTIFALFCIDVTGKEYGRIIIGGEEASEKFNTHIDELLHSFADEISTNSGNQSRVKATTTNPTQSKRGMRIAHKSVNATCNGMMAQNNLVADKSNSGALMVEPEERRFLMAEAPRWHSAEAKAAFFTEIHSVYNKAQSCTSTNLDFLIRTGFMLAYGPVIPRSFAETTPLETDLKKRAEAVQSTRLTSWVTCATTGSPPSVGRMGEHAFSTLAIWAAKLDTFYHDIGVYDVPNNAARGSPASTLLCAARATAHIIHTQHYDRTQRHLPMPCTGFAYDGTATFSSMMDVAAASQSRRDLVGALGAGIAVPPPTDTQMAIYELIRDANRVIFNSCIPRTSQTQSYLVMALTMLAERVNNGDMSTLYNLAAAQDQTAMFGDPEARRWTGVITASSLLNDVEWKQLEATGAGRYGFQRHGYARIDMPMTKPVAFGAPGAGPTTDRFRPAGTFMWVGSLANVRSWLDDVGSRRVWDCVCEQDNCVCVPVEDADAGGNDIAVVVDDVVGAELVAVEMDDDDDAIVVVNGREAVSSPSLSLSLSPPAPSVAVARPPVRPSRERPLYDLPDSDDDEDLAGFAALMRQFHGGNRQPSPLSPPSPPQHARDEARSRSQQQLDRS